MSLEYEGQTIQSMKWNGQEILGGGDSGSGNVEVIIDRFIGELTGRYDSSETYKYVVTQSYAEDLGLYHVSLGWVDAMLIGANVINRPAVTGAKKITTVTDISFKNRYDATPPYPYVYDDEMQYYKLTQHLPKTTYAMGEYTPGNYLLYIQLGTDGLIKSYGTSSLPTLTLDIYYEAVD